MKLTTLTVIAMLAMTAAHANTETPEPETPTEPEPSLPEYRQPADKASGATSANLCDRPTSIIPAGYAPDAKTWPCKNWSK